MDGVDVRGKASSLKDIGFFTNRKDRRSEGGGMRHFVEHWNGRMSYNDIMVYRNVMRREFA